MKILVTIVARYEIVEDGEIGDILKEITDAFDNARDRFAAYGEIVKCSIDPEPSK